MITRRALWTLLLAPLLALGGVAVAFYEPDLPASEVEALYADSESLFLEVLGSRVHVKDEGDPELPALLLLHGFASSLHTWDGWASELSGRFRIVRLDLPGFGLTGPNQAGEDGAGDYSTSYRIRVIERVLEERGVGRASVAGNSLGGLVAWRYAQAHPERVAALVLVNAAGAPRGGPGAEAADAAAPKRGFRTLDLLRIPMAAELMQGLTPRFLIASSLEQVYADPGKITDPTIDRHHRMLLREGNRRAILDAMRSHGGRLPPSGAAPLSAIQQPTLVMWGRQDRWIPPADAEIFRDAIPNSELVIYDDAGHVPMEELPARSARDAADFLQRQLAGREHGATPAAEPGG
ncbi:MAG: alpha/beta hydrolase [Acidobacteriota bacterium]